jgi:hypothetical protein
MSNALELQSIEEDCLQRFRTRAAEIRKGNPGMSTDRAFQEAVLSLPAIASRYDNVRLLLAQMGVPSLPLRRR